MNKTSSYDLAGSGYEALASAIIIQAADDYKKYRFVIDTTNLRTYKSMGIKYDVLNNAKRQVKSVESFFRSFWFDILSRGLDGKKALEGLENTYLTEYYPERMKEWDD